MNTARSRICLSAAVLLTAAVTSAQIQTYTDETAFLAALTALGHPIQTESFDGSAWDGVRTTNAGGAHTAPSVTANGITWSGAHAITTSDIGRTGWAVFDHVGGDPDVLYGTSSTLLYGVGGWFYTNTPLTTLRISIDGVSPDSASIAMSGDYQFLGAVVPAGFVTFELRDMEASPADVRHWFADDFTLARGSVPANHPPDGVIALPATDVTVSAGQAVSFVGSATDPDGDAVTLSWAFGDGTTRTGLALDYVYYEEGVHLITLTATDSRALADPTPATRTITVTPTPAIFTTGVVPGVAAVAGLAGSDWHTDLYLHNAWDQEVSVALYFSPRGGTVDPTQERTLVVQAGETVTLPDVVATTFGTSGSGAIHWRALGGASSRLLVSADTYNRVDATHRFGQQVEGVRWGQAAAPGISQSVPAIAGRYRTNLGFATDASCTRVEIRGYDRFGTQKVVQALDVPPLTWWQLDDLFRLAFPGLLANPAATPIEESIHRFEVTGINGKVVAATSIIDNSSNDGSQFVGQWRLAAPRSLWFPSAALIDGANGSHWRSDAFLFNLTGQDVSAPLAYLPEGRDNGTVPAGTSVALPASGAIARENLLLGTFILAPPTKGTVRVDAPAAGAFLGWLRTYTEEPDATGATITYGQAVAPLGPDHTVLAGTEGRLYGFSQGAGVRSNLILQNTRAAADGTGLPATVAVDLLDAGGARLAGHSYQLRPGEYLQDNRFVETYGVASLTGGCLRVVVTDGQTAGATGGVAAFVSELNGNLIPGTNDGRLLAAETVPVLAR